MESFGLKQNTDSALEQEPLDIERGIKRERAMLEKFRGKAKDIARVLLFVSALSAGSFVWREAHATEARPTGAKIEQTQSVQHQEQMQYSKEMAYVILDEKQDELILRANRLSGLILIVREKYQERDAKHRSEQNNDKIAAALEKASRKMSDTWEQMQQFSERMSDLINVDAERAKSVAENMEKAHIALDEVERLLGDVIEKLSGKLSA